MLDRETDKDGNVIIHPHEALQSIAVELARGNAIAQIQAKLADRIAIALEALVVQAETSREDVAAAREGGLRAVQDLLGPALAPVLARLGKAPTVPESRPALPSAGPRLVEAPSKTARIVAAPPAPPQEV